MWYDRAMIAHSSPARPRPFRVGPQPVAITAARVRPDRYALFVIALMSLLTVSTPVDEVFGVPRMTLASVPFTIYMLVYLKFRIHPKIRYFLIAYILAFLPTTLVHAFVGEIKTTSFIQGILSLVTLGSLATYFHQWLLHTPEARQKSNFHILSIFFIAICALETIFYSQFAQARALFYEVYSKSGNLTARELALYGGRPTSFFSEPSNFARYIGIMMAAYLAVARASSRSLVTAGILMVITRSASYFVAIPSLVMTARRVLGSGNPGTKTRRPSGKGYRLIALIAISGLVLGGIAYTQAKRIDDALNGTSVQNKTGIGDGSLNERIVLPLNYFFEKDAAVLIGNGPTPQEKVQTFMNYEMHLVYGWPIRYEYLSAVSATIMMVAGMGLLGVAIFFTVLYALSGRSGLHLGFAFFVSNMFASGYNTTLAFVPSALILAIVIYEQVQARRQQPVPKHSARARGIA